MRRRILAISLLATLPAACTSGAHREVITPASAQTLARYSAAVRSGDFLFLSGQVGLKPDTRELVTGGIEAETRQTLANIRTVLDAAGVSVADVVKCTVFLADMGEYAAMNAMYADFFGDEPPARSAVAVAALPLNARVEIECIAAVRR